ncbi:MAG: S41 family peptidase [Ahniella sp.]|nr:S41 family peptidase [Ahniella sp.]
MKKSIAFKIGAGLGAAVLLTGLLVVTGVLPSPAELLSRKGPPQADMVVDKTLRDEVLDGVIANLNSYYVFPDQAKQIEMALRNKLTSGGYDAITSAEDLAATLTADIHQVNNDRHIDVAYSEAVLTDAEFEESEDEALTAEQVAELKRLNYGVHAASRLPGNIGYLDIQSFPPAEAAAPKYAAAMSLLSDTKALIIDLRANQGGQPEAVALLASYLFDERTHLNDIYLRDGNQTIEMWTQDTLAGPRYGAQRKVYLLTSVDTFSAGEDFAYALKNLKRATLIGKATGGGAHPGSPRRINEHFAMIVPSGRSISPITQTDWEGTGVLPDIEMDPEDALVQAQILILKDQLTTEKDPRVHRLLEARLDDLE